jgi:hypothetical protein
MNGQFKTYRFSLSGRTHRLEGSECQDSYVVLQGDRYLLALVSDGVGSSKNSKLGSVLLSQAINRLVGRSERQLIELSESMPPQEFGFRFVAWVNRNLQGEFELLRTMLGSERGDGHAERALCATLGGWFLTEKTTIGFGCGDFVFAVNDEIHRAVAGQLNKPNLPIYAAMASEETRRKGRDGNIQLYFALETASVRSAGVGTDGSQEMLPTFFSAKGIDGGVDESLMNFVIRSLAVSTIGSAPGDDATFIGLHRISDAPARETADVTGIHPQEGELLCV